MLFIEVVTITRPGTVQWAQIHSGPRILRRIAERQRAFGRPPTLAIRTKGSVALCPSDDPAATCSYILSAPREFDDGMIRRDFPEELRDVLLSETEAA